MCDSVTHWRSAEQANSTATLYVCPTLGIVGNKHMDAEGWAEDCSEDESPCLYQTTEHIRAVQNLVLWPKSILLKQILTSAPKLGMKK